MSFHGSTHTDTLRRLVGRTRNEEVDLYDGDNPDGRGGQGAPTLVAEAVPVASKPLSGEKATQFLGERLQDQWPKAFFFAPDQILPDTLYILHDDILYREEKRVNSDVRRMSVCVLSDDQSTA